MADRSVGVRRPASGARSIHAAGHSGRKIGLTAIATVGNPEHVIVRVQDFRISSISTGRSPSATAGTDYDRQALTLLNR